MIDVINTQQTARHHYSSMCSYTGDLYIVAHHYSPGLSVGLYLNVMSDAHLTLT